MPIVQQARAPSRSLLIRGAGVVTMDPANGDLPAADIHVSAGRIEAIGRDLDAPGAEIIDARRMIAMPGFVDGHRHLWEGLLRGALPVEDLMQYFARVNNGFVPVHTPEDAYLGTLIGALGALDAGVTTVFDWSHIQNSPDHTAACVSALKEAGLRAIFAFGFGGTPRTKWPDDIVRLREQQEFASSDGLLTLALATMSPEHVPDQVARGHFELARKAGVMVSIHAGLSGMGTPGEIERYGREGLLGPHVNLAHCNTLSEAEWRIIAETGTSVSITPTVEMQMGQGVPPIQQALDAGIFPAIGVDVETTAPGDMFSQLRAVYALQRMNAFARRWAGEQAPAMLDADGVLELATSKGAAAIGLGDRTGMLRPGMQADIVLLRADALNVAPVSDMRASIVLNMDARNVDTVLVAGRVVKRGGQMLGVDRESLMARLHAARDRVFGATSTAVRYSFA